MNLTFPMKPTKVISLDGARPTGGGSILEKRVAAVISRACLCLLRYNIIYGPVIGRLHQQAENARTA